VAASVPDMKDHNDSELAGADFEHFRSDHVRQHLRRMSPILGVPER